MNQRRGVKRLTSLMGERSSLFATGTLYLAPRLMPFGLVVLLTLCYGVAGLGDVALALSLWQFLLIVADFGVSQWLLTKHALTRREIRVAIIGRLSVGCLVGVAAAFLVTWGVFVIPPLLMAALALSLGLSFGQMAFSWEIQRGRPRLALFYVIIEFVAPLIVMLGATDPPTALILVIASKTLLGIGLTTFALMRIPVAAEPVGLGPRAFGVNSSAWALTSVASGTGELAVLGAAGFAALGGTYRIFQTVASLGSVVGFAALAPLMSKDGRRIQSLRKPMFLLGGLACAMLAAGMVPGLMLTSDAVGDNSLWAVSSATALAFAALLNTLAIVPLSSVAREVGSKYALRIGLASSVCYWALIALFAGAGLPLLVALAPLAASVVGLVGNLLVWQRTIRRSLRAVRSTSVRVERFHEPETR